MGTVGVAGFGFFFFLGILCAFTIEARGTFFKAHKKKKEKNLLFFLST